MATLIRKKFENIIVSYLLILLFKTKRDEEILRKILILGANEYSFLTTIAQMAGKGGGHLPHTLRNIECFNLTLSYERLKIT